MKIMNIHRKIIHLISGPRKEKFGDIYFRDGRIPRFCYSNSRKNYSRTRITRVAKNRIFLNEHIIFGHHDHSYVLLSEDYSVVHPISNIGQLLNK